MVFNSAFKGLRYCPNFFGELRKATKHLPKYESKSWSLERACTAEDEHGAAYYINWIWIVFESWVYIALDVVFLVSVSRSVRGVSLS